MTDQQYHNNQPANEVVIKKKLSPCFGIRDDWWCSASNKCYCYNNYIIAACWKDSQSKYWLLILWKQRRWYVLYCHNACWLFVWHNSYHAYFDLHIRLSVDLESWSSCQNLCSNTFVPLLPTHILRTTQLPPSHRHHAISLPPSSTSLFNTLFPLY